jgi:putative NADH-flavin reductase
MKVLIVGATGRTGQELVKQALAAGHEVTALCRDPSKLADQPGVRAAKGDVKDRASLSSAAAGQDAVLYAVGSNKSSPPGIRAEGVRNLVAAMDEKGVPRLVVLSAFGAGDSKGEGGFVYSKIIAKLFMKAVLADQDAMEAEVTKSGLDWTLVRPTRLTDGPAVGTWDVIFEGGKASSKISRADTAAFMLQQLQDRTYVGKAPGITN